MANDKTQLLRIPDDYHLANLEITDIFGDYIFMTLNQQWLRVSGVNFPEVTNQKQHKPIKAPMSEHYFNQAGEELKNLLDFTHICTKTLESGF